VECLVRMVVEEGVVVVLITIEDTTMKGRMVRLDGDLDGDLLLQKIKMIV
jgi:hypothetical protein